jgi:ankyrin repeat protein
VLTLTNLKEVNAVDNNSHSLSFVAARQGNAESLKCLLDRGANHMQDACVCPVTF